MASTLTITVQPLQRGTASYLAAVGDRIVAIMTEAARTVEARAKAEHPWQNQTGAAEAGLTTEVIHDAAQQIVTLWLAHGVDYGWWLETKWGGRYAVILPVLESSYAPIMAALQAAVRP